MFFAQEAARSGIHGGLAHRGGVMLREDHNARVGKALFDAPGCFDAVDWFHGDVHDRPVGALAGERGYRFSAIGAFDEVVREMAEGGSQKPPHFLVIINDHDFHSLCVATTD